MKPRVIHADGPHSPHPFKRGTLCGKLVRFGGLEAEARPVTCKICLKLIPFAKEFDALRQRVQDLMGWDIFKADKWMKTKNTLLGDQAPIDFIRLGTGHKVEKFISAAEEENKPLDNDGKLGFYF
jgi:hypothetical protein